MRARPQTWYWVADDGRVFSGPLEATVDANDQGFVDWTGAGHNPTPWPRDEAGEQTDAALQATIGPFGMFANLAYYAADARFRKAGGGLIVSSLSAVPFDSDVTSRHAVHNAADVAAGGSQTTAAWKMSDNSFVVLDAAQLTTLWNALADFTQACFNCESQVAAGVADGSVTSKQQVDDAFDAIPNTYPSARRR